MIRDAAKIAIPLNIYDPSHPLGGNITANPKIYLTNQKHFVIKKEMEANYPKYILKISDPASLASNFQNQNVENFSESVMLSCNLVLQRAVFSKNISNFLRAEIERKKENIPSKVVDMPTGKGISITEKIYLHETVFGSIIFEEKLDERKIIDVLQKIIKIRNEEITEIKNGQKNFNKKISNIQKALQEYQCMTTNFQRQNVFRCLFSSLELATNYDGKNRTGINLDEEVNKICEEVTEIKNLRNFNSRIKHIDKTLASRSKYDEGMNRLGENIILTRKLSQKIILNRLSSIWCS